MRGDLYLVDGTAYIHRAYHAIRNLTNSKGFPTNAVFGFTRMLLKLLKEKKPEHLAVVFDAKGPTFRHRIYSDYKANRPPMAEDMAVQIPIIKRVVEGLNLTALEKVGYESDDVIATLARMGEEAGFRVIIVTGDKDFRQVVTEKTSMWDPVKDSFTDYLSLKERCGFEPVRFVDVMALSGDSADNIPGVPGIGEKTGSDLVREFGSLEDVLEHATELAKRRLREKLLQHADLALMSKRLVKLDRHVALDARVDGMGVGAPDCERLAVVFQEMGFKGLLDQFSPGGKSVPFWERPQTIGIP